MVEVREANLYLQQDCQALVQVLDAYSSDPNGAGAPLSEEVKSELADRLCRLNHRKIFLASSDNRAVGAAICFVSFSTFKAREVVNILDLAVLTEYRNRGVGSALLNAVEDFARQLQACKITLEVREKNVAAERLYLRKGFNNPNGTSERSFFLERQLADVQAYC